MNKRDKVVGESRIRVRNADTEPRRWRTYFLIGICSTLILSGFFFAGRQHFSSMDYGMRNSKMRNQIVQLEAEKRRLVLAREVSLSPAEIRKAARKAGIIGTPETSTIAAVTPVTKDRSVPTPAEAPAGTGHLVIKTAVVSPAKAEPQTVALKTESSLSRPVRKTTVAAE